MCCRHRSQGTSVRGCPFRCLRTNPPYLPLCCASSQGLSPVRSNLVLLQKKDQCLYSDSRFIFFVCYFFLILASGLRVCPNCDVNFTESQTARIPREAKSACSESLDNTFDPTSDRTGIEIRCERWCYYNKYIVSANNGSRARSEDHISGPNQVY